VWELAGEHAPDHEVSAEQPLVVDIDATLVTSHSGNAGSNTAADHITVLRDALRQLPGHQSGRRPGRISVAGVGRGAAGLSDAGGIGHGASFGVEAGRSAAPSA
jgi:hypothetical protein